MSRNLAILLGVRNMAHTLGRAVGSILKQTYKNFDLFVLDNASEDNPYNEIKNIKDERLFYFRLNFHKVRATALNYGLRLTQYNYKYIGIQDADDMSGETRLQKQIDLLDKENVDIVSSWYKANDGRTKELPESHAKIIEKLLKHPTLCHGSMIAKAEVFRTLQGYDEEMQVCVDWDFYIRAMKANFQFRNIPETLYKIGFARHKCQADVDQYMKDLEYLKNKHKF